MSGDVACDCRMMQYDRGMKRSIAVFSLVLLLSGCALPPDPVPKAPRHQAPAVVFDIDGTLTPDVLSVFQVRPHAVESAHIYADKGYEIIYLSARVKVLQSRIPGWLEKHEFPEGAVHVTETAEDKKDHAAFKARILKEYVSNGWKLAYAYGDSTTDFEAYAAAGIPQERVFALQRRSDEQPQPGTYHAHMVTWDEHLEYIRSTPDAE